MELEEMQERVDALEEENKALSDQVVSSNYKILTTVLLFVDRSSGQL
jgi:cell shape-determining protein MreC